MGPRLYFELNYDKLLASYPVLPIFREILPIWGNFSWIRWNLPWNGKNFPVPQYDPAVMHQSMRASLGGADTGMSKMLKGVYPTILVSHPDLL